MKATLDMFHMVICNSNSEKPLALNWPGVPENSHVLYSKAERPEYLVEIRRVKRTPRDKRQKSERWFQRGCYSQRRSSNIYACYLPNIELSLDRSPKSSRTATVHHLFTNIVNFRFKLVVFCTKKTEKQAIIITGRRDGNHALTSVRQTK